MHGSYGRTRAEAQAPASIIPPHIRRFRKATLRRVNRWRARNPERQAALSAVAVAIQNFDLVRGPCERCGTTKNVCADPISLHPLRVKWRCRSCGIAQRRLARKQGEKWMSDTQSAPSAAHDHRRWLAYIEGGEVALFEDCARSNAEWLNIGVTSIPEDRCWRFGWNGARVSFTYDSKHLQVHHPEIFALVVSILEELTDGGGNRAMRACRRDWLIRSRDKFERQAVLFVEINQQIAALDAELCAEVPTTEVHG
jgi:hypothetical protein